MTLGGLNHGQTTLTRRRLAAGDVQTRRWSAGSPSGDQKDGGEYLRVAGGEPRRLVVVVELRVAGIDAGDEPCGCRGTGVVESVAREHGEGRGMVLQVPGVAVELMAMVVRPLDGRSLVGDELVRRRVRVSYVQWLRSSRGRKERMGRWPGSRWLRRSGR